jgi:hypothetical protein
MDSFLKDHSGELTILILSALVLGCLLFLVPQLLRAHQKKLEIRHTERLKTMELGLPTTDVDERSIFAGRAAVLVPMVAIGTAGTVTCFLVAYRSELIFSVALAVWSVAGVVSLAAITGGVALMGRLAQINAGQEDDELLEQPATKESREP